MSVINETPYDNELFQSDSFDIKATLFKYLNYWYLFVLAFFVTISVAYVFNKYSKSIYQGSTTIIINDDQATINPMMSNAGLYQTKTLENEIIILNSSSLMKATISKLDMQVSYYVEKKIFTYELYKTSPYSVVIHDSISNKIFHQTKINIDILSETQFYLHSEHLRLNLQDTFSFGETIVRGELVFKILMPDYQIAKTFYKKSNTFFFTLNNMEDLSFQFQRNMQISSLDENTDAVIITLSDLNNSKIIDLLNTFTEVYIKKSLEKKNQISINTISFINDQLISISDTLNKIENKLQMFRTSNKIMNMNTKTQEISDLFRELNNEKAEISMRLKYYNLVKESIEKDSVVSQIFSPSTVGIENQLLNNLINKLIALYTEKTELQYNSTIENNITQALSNNINNLETTILSNIDNSINSTLISLESVEKRLNTISKQFELLPENDRQLFKIEREFKFNDEIYTFLLEKQSEAQIAKASNLPDREILEIANYKKCYRIYPRKKQNYSIAYILGFIIPIILITIKDAFNDKIVEKKEVLSITKFPILGFIVHSEKKSNSIVYENPRSSISESFRTIRTKLPFFINNNDDKCKTILVTSSITGEGKTFCSINIASIIALSGKKTLLLGFDLRKPSIYNDFGLSNDKGISSYLIGKDPLNEIIQQSPLENLDISVGGPIPPNPSELIAMNKTKEMLDLLAKDYDYIVIDTSPIGLVADAFVLMKYVDLNIYLVRQDHSAKKIFTNNIGELENSEIDNLCVLINDVKHGYGYGYNYRYRYRQKYGNDYYYGGDDVPKKGFLNKYILNKF